jgi:hypothetical protein
VIRLLDAVNLEYLTGSDDGGPATLDPSASHLATALFRSHLYPTCSLSLRRSSLVHYYSVYNRYSSGTRIDTLFRRCHFSSPGFAGLKSWFAVGHGIGNLIEALAVSISLALQVIYYGTSFAWLSFLPYCGPTCPV